MATPARRLSGRRGLAAGLEKSRRFQYQFREDETRQRFPLGNAAHLPIASRRRLGQHFNPLFFGQYQPALRDASGGVDGRFFPIRFNRRNCDLNYQQCPRRMLFGVTVGRNRHDRNVRFRLRIEEGQRVFFSHLELWLAGRLQQFQEPITNRGMQWCFGHFANYDPMQQFNILLQNPELDERMVGLDRDRFYLASNRRMFQHFNHRAHNLTQSPARDKRILKRPASPLKTTCL